MARHQNERKLFKEEPLPELSGGKYYAYLDSVERRNGKYFIRFDCIDVRRADQVAITSETILDFPSVVIEVLETDEKINILFPETNLYKLESHWLMIETAIGETTQDTVQYFNFTGLGNTAYGNANGLQSVTTASDMAPLEKNKISEIERATLLQASTINDINDFLNDPAFSGIDHVNVYDVGQGSCNGLVDSENRVKAYFDLGGGCNANQFTYPADFQICCCADPLVILSHWDQDHIETALREPRSWGFKWLVPPQKLSNTAYHLANRLIKNGNLLCWNSSMASPHPFQGNFIMKCTGSANNKNNSGLALLIGQEKAYVCLPGDARFGEIPIPPACQISALVASHHGAKGSVYGSVRYGQPNNPPNASGLRIIAYSYGERDGRLNTFGHAHTIAMRTYGSFGWSIRKLTRDGNIALKNQPVVLGTPCGGATGVRSCSLQIAAGQHA